MNPGVVTPLPRISLALIGRPDPVQFSSSCCLKKTAATSNGKTLKTQFEHGGICFEDKNLTDEATSFSEKIFFTVGFEKEYFHEKML